MKINTIKVRRQIIVFLIACIGSSATLGYLWSSGAIAKEIRQEKVSTKPASANINEVKSFVYSWFALLDRQVSEISLLKFLDTENLTMQFPETTVSNQEEFGDWYLSVQKAIETNTHDIRQLEVTPTKNGEFEVKLVVDWQARTRQGEMITQTYQQQWKVVTNERKRLLIRDYLVAELQ